MAHRDFRRPLEERMQDSIARHEARNRELRETGRSAPWLNRLCPLYTYALDQLEGYGGRFDEAQAADALRTADARLALPDAIPYGEQPDAGDVRAFLRALLEDEVVSADGRGGYVINEELLPF
jgi:hypothetical protein